MVFEYSTPTTSALPSHYSVAEPSNNQISFDTSSDTSAVFLFDNLDSSPLSEPLPSSDIFNQPTLLTNRSEQISNSKFSFNGTNMGSRRKKIINLDPAVRPKSDCGVSLEDVIKCGINPDELDPRVKKRLKNTDASRKAREKKRQKMIQLEQMVEEQDKKMHELEKLAMALKHRLAYEIHESQRWKNAFLVLDDWLRCSGIKGSTEMS